jgi:hypothetical protein
MASSSRIRATPDRIAIAEREARALELGKGGWTFDAVAREVGFTEREAAHKAVSRALEATVRQQRTSCGS